MTWITNLLIVDALVLVLVGCALVLGAIPRRPRVRLLVGNQVYRPRVSARQLGLAHRLAARLVVSPVRPADENFVAIAELYNLGPREPMPQLTRYFATVDPLCLFEDFVERLESLSARMRSERR